MLCVCNFKTANIEFFLHRANYFIKILCLTIIWTYICSGIKVDHMFITFFCSLCSDKMSDRGCYV